MGINRRALLKREQSAAPLVVDTTFPLSACCLTGLLISVWSESKPKLQSLRSSSLLLRSFTKSSSLVRSLALLQTLSNDDSSSEDTSLVARSLKLLTFSHRLMLEMEG